MDHSSNVTAANITTELNPLDFSCTDKLKGYLKQLFPVWYTDEVIKLKEERDSPPGLNDELLQFTGLVHCTQHRSLNLAWKKIQAVLELSIGRINLFVCTKKNLGFLGDRFFFLLLFVFFMISNFI